MEARKGLHFLVRRWGIEPQGKSILAPLLPRLIHTRQTPEPWPLRPADPLAHRMNSSAHLIHIPLIDITQNTAYKRKHQRNGVERIPESDGRNNKRSKL